MEQSRGSLFNDKEYNGVSGKNENSRTNEYSTGQIGNS